MKIVALDVHSECSQMTVASEETGEVLLELKVPTRPEDLRRVVGGIPGPKRVLFEEGPMSGLIRDALEGLAEEVVSCDPTRNALVARAEDSSDERDARRLIVLNRARATHPVFVPPEPYRTLRSLLHYDHRLARAVTGVKNGIKAAFRRQGIHCRGVRVYGRTGRSEALKKQVRGMDAVRRLQTIPGVGPVTARTLVAWVVDPLRFRSRKALSSYGGLGLGQGFTNRQPTGRARASKRGRRELKRALFLAARGAIRSKGSALARRYEARLASGWEDRKAIRDIARCILFIARSVWITGKEYQDARVSVPQNQSGAR